MTHPLVSYPHQLYRDYFQVPLPSRTTIVKCLGAAIRYEVEAVAVKRK